MLIIRTLDESSTQCPRHLWHSVLCACVIEHVFGGRLYVELEWVSLAVTLYPCCKEKSVLCQVLFLFNSVRHGCLIVVDRVSIGISRDSWHKRRKTGGKRTPLRKKRKFELGRPAANTKVMAAINCSVCSKFVLAWSEENSRGEMSWRRKEVQRIKIRPWELLVGL